MVGEKLLPQKEHGFVYLEFFQLANLSLPELDSFFLIVSYFVQKKFVPARSGTSVMSFGLNGFDCSNIAKCLVASVNK